MRGMDVPRGGVLEMQVMMGLDLASRIIIKLTSYS